ncbi:uncharacterized protein LOC127833295 [Dreissena polymorpha]|nr:uncharacterized protein LOC127833295 [Dreissena polymorpha]
MILNILVFFEKPCIERCPFHQPNRSECVDYAVSRLLTSQDRRNRQDHLSTTERPTLYSIRLLITMVCGDLYNVEDVLSLFLDEPTFKTQPKGFVPQYGFNSFSFTHKMDDGRSFKVFFTVASYHEAKSMINQIPFDRCVFVYHKFRRSSITSLRRVIQSAACPKMLIEVQYCNSGTSSAHQSLPLEEGLRPVAVQVPEYFKSPAYRQMLMSFVIFADTNLSIIGDLQLHCIDETTSRSSSPKSDQSEQSSSDDPSFDSKRSSTLSENNFADTDSSVTSSEKIFCKQRDVSKAMPTHKAIDLDIARNSTGAHMVLDERQDSSTRYNENCCDFDKESINLSEIRDGDQTNCKTTYHIQNALRQNHDMEQTSAKCVKTENEDTTCTILEVLTGRKEKRDAEQTRIKSIESREVQTYVKTTFSNCDVSFADAPTTLINETEQLLNTSNCRPTYFRCASNEPPNLIGVDMEGIYIELKQCLTDDAFALLKGTKKEMAYDIRRVKKAAKKARRAQRNCEEMIEKNRKTGCFCNIC